MSRSPRFWTLLALFQVAFGLAVFGFTRAYYLDRAKPARPAHADMPFPAARSGNDLEQAMSDFPGLASLNDPDAAERQADNYFSAGDYPRAADLYAQLVKGGLGNVNTYNSLGLTLAYLGRTDEALAVLNEGIALDGSYQRIWLTLGYVNAQDGRIDPARKALGQAVELGPDTDVGKAAAEMMAGLP